MSLQDMIEYINKITVREVIIHVVSIFDCVHLLRCSLRVDKGLSVRV